MKNADIALLQSTALCSQLIATLAKLLLSSLVGREPERTLRYQLASKLLAGDRVSI